MAGGLLTAGDPHLTSAVHDGAVDDGTGDVPQEPNGTLDKAQSHGLVRRLDTPKGEEHGAHLGGGVDQDDDDKNKSVHME